MPASTSPPRATSCTNTVYLIDRPTVLRLAHAQHLDIKMAREKLAEAQADNESATLKFFPWLTAGIAYRRHDGQIQNTEGDILTVSKQSYAPGGVLVGQWTLAMPFTKSLPPNNLKTPPTTPSRLSVRTPSRLRPEMALRTVHDWLLLALKPRNVNMLVRSQPGYTSLSST